ncbi:MAG: matrixin family metalloprotease, partial [Myxococcales bacterium]
MPLLFLAPASALAQQCAASCTTTSASRCAGTQACICSTSPRWQTSAPVRWGLFHHASGIDGVPFTRLESEVRGAFNAWDNQTCSKLAFSYQGTFTTARPADAINPNDRLNRLAWISSNWAFGPGTLGVTHAVWTTGSNYLSDADIEFNDDNKVWSDTGAGASIDVFSIALHEAGHFWGATHTPHTGSVMYYAYPGGQKRTPSADDVAQLCCLYPTNTAAGAQGDFCQSTSGCQSGLVCARPASGGDLICTRACNPVSPSCPAGYTSCESAVSSPSGTTNACFVAPTAPSDLCAFCDKGSECSSGLCLGTPPYAFCSSSCTSDRQCGIGYRCATLSSGSQACVPLNTDSTGGRVCPTPQCTSQKPCKALYHCEPNGMCKGGRLDESCALQNDCDTPTAHACITTDREDYICRKYCSTRADCASDHDCYALSGSSRGVCLPAPSGADAGTPGDAGTVTVGPCASCTSGSQCPAGYDCVTTSTGARCHKRCTANPDCSSESVCGYTGSSTNWCVCPNELAARDQPCGQAVGKFCGQLDLCVSGVGSSDPRCRQRCTANSQCASNNCVSVAGGGAVCGPPVAAPDAGVAPDAGTRDAGLLADAGV